MALRPTTQAEFLKLWREALPASYTQPIEDEAGGAGLDVASMQAAIFAEAEAAINVSQQAYFLRRHSIQTGETARSGAKARTTLQIYRAAPALGALQVRRGQALLARARDSFGGELELGRFFPVVETTLASGAGGPVPLEVEAEFEGYAGNVWEGVITSFEPEGRLSVPALITAPNEARRADDPSSQGSDRFHPGLVGRMLRIVPLTPLTTPDANLPRQITNVFAVGDDFAINFAPPLLAADVLTGVSVELEEMADLGVTVTQPNPATGGRVDVLAAVGAERGIERSTDTTDDEHVEQLTELPDTVTPGALERAAARVLDPWGIPWCLHETGEPTGLMGFTWDLHPWDYGTLCGCGDEESSGGEFLGEGVVVLSEAQHVRFFVVCVGRRPITEMGAAWDATDQGGDTPNAWDEFPWDGDDAGFLAVIGRLWDELNKVRMAGVNFAIALDESL